LLLEPDYRKSTLLLVPHGTISLNEVFEAFADWEDQLEPYKHELEELGL